MESKIRDYYVERKVCLSETARVDESVKLRLIALEKHETLHE